MGESYINAIIKAKCITLLRGRRCFCVTGCFDYRCSSATVLSAIASFFSSSSSSPLKRTISRASLSLPTRFARTASCRRWRGLWQPDLKVWD